MATPPSAWYLRVLCLLAALQTSVHSAPAQTVEIRPAVELGFATRPGSVYRVETSVDLARWNPLGPTALGDGQKGALLASAKETSAYFRVATQDYRNLNALLEPIRAANKVPALACAVVLSNQIVGLGAVGLRRAGVTSAPVTLQDKWHHGSLTKAMTATLAAILVEQGKIQWNSTLADIFPDWAPKMNPAWRGATLEQLSSNRGGATGDLNGVGIWNPLWNFVGTPREGRRFLLEKLTVLPPSSPPGTKYEYSNAGFSLAGHMLETRMDKPWEELMTEYLFRPLDMTSGGFGVPATPRYLDQPWGHQLAGGQPSPIEPGTSADNPPGIGPSATAHCSVMDLAKYVAFHIAGHNGDTALLKQASFLKLHQAYPNNESYAHGWTELERPWAAPGKAYTHTGSNTQWISVIWFAPARHFGVVALCNLATSTGANPGATAVDQVAGKMIQEFLR